MTGTRPCRSRGGVAEVESRDTVKDGLLHSLELRQAEEEWCDSDHPGAGEHAQEVVAEPLRIGTRGANISS